MDETSQRYSYFIQLKNFMSFDTDRVSFRYKQIIYHKLQLVSFSYFKETFVS